MREEFENYIISVYGPTHEQPWSITERSGDGYLDLYTQLRWEGWQAARELWTSKS